MADLATLQSWLAAAETALDKLITGNKVVEIRHGQNELMSFEPAQVGQLRAYIADLKGQIGALTGQRLPGSRVRGRRAFF